MKRIYHISPIKNRQSISQKGLILNAGERALRFNQSEDRIYLVDKLWKVLKLINCSMWNSHPDFQSGFDVYEILENVETSIDEKFQYGIYTKVKINRIKLVATLKNKKVI